MLFPAGVTDKGGFDGMVKGWEEKEVVVPVDKKTTENPSNTGPKWRQLEEGRG